MKEFFLDLMIFTGSALMAYNIYGYVCFSRDVRKHGNWDQMQRLFNLPILLLILFFIGYLVVGIFGKPDLVMAGILFGGSIFVFVMLLLIRRTFRMNSLRPDCLPLKKQVKRKHSSCPICPMTSAHH